MDSSFRHWDCGSVKSVSIKLRDREGLRLWQMAVAWEKDGSCFLLCAMLQVHVFPAEHEKAVAAVKATHTKAAKEGTESR